MDCKLYCMGISAFSTVFLFYLFFIVAIGSQTLYLQVKNRFTSAVALFVSSLIYAGIFGYLYYDIYVNIDRKQDLKRWLEQKRIKKELGQIDRRGQIRTSKMVEMH